mmetsp:Transcript_48234/g.92195  ORF Transcript_48234/g.92195 Transcript_48234/m.92195 type:complete len:339 (-) Transcript_48234:2254-3270(-)
MHVGKAVRQQLYSVLPNKLGVVRKRRGPKGVCVPERYSQGGRQHQVVEVLQYERLALEAGLVKDVSKHSKHLLHQHDVVRLVELVAKLRLLEGVQHLKEKVQPHFRNVALRVPECPHHRVDDQLEILRRETEHGAEAVVGDGAQQLKKLGAVLRVVLKVAGDHLQSALEDGVKDSRHLVGELALHFVENGGEQGEHLRVARVRNVAHVVAKDRVHHGRHHLGTHQVRVFRLHHKHLDEAQALALDGPHELHLRGARAKFATLHDRRGDKLRVQLVHVQHVLKDEGDLRLEGLAHRPAHGGVCLKDVGNAANHLGLLESLRVGARHLDYLVPVGVWRLH